MEKLIERLKSKAWASNPRGMKDSVYLDDVIELIEAHFEQNCIKHVVSGSLPLETLNVQIAFAQQKQIDADESGDEKGEEAWYGYLNALRWVESELKRQ